MPQILKEDVRTRIENSALDILLEKGLHDTDMRSIAKKAGVTPGNLYRYFTNKDQLIVSITQPLIDRLNNIILEESKGELNLLLESTLSTYCPDGVSLHEYLSLVIQPKLLKILVEIAEMGKEHPKRMKILLGDSIVGDRLRGWAVDTVIKSFDNGFKYSSATKYEINTILKVFTLSFCHGILHLLEASLETDINTFKKLTVKYVDFQMLTIGVAIKNEVMNGTITINKEGFKNGI